MHLIRIPLPSVGGKVIYSCNGNGGQKKKLQKFWTGNKVEANAVVVVVVAHFYHSSNWTFKPPKKEIEEKKGGTKGEGDLYSFIVVGSRHEAVTIYYTWLCDEQAVGVMGGKFMIIGRDPWSSGYLTVWQYRPLVCCVFI